MTITIDESGMKFGPYPEDHCFVIEKSATYQRVQQDLPIAEFLLLRTPEGRPAEIWLIEAKSSTPRPATQPHFDDFIADIRDKLNNALALGVAACLKRHPSAAAELPAGFHVVDWSNTALRLILVIRGHQEAWLPPLQSALQKALRPTVKSWSQTEVIVLNDRGARKHGLIA